MEHLTTENFKHKISKGLILIDFYATWCGPCKLLTPVLETISKTLEGATIYKVDVDSAPEIAEQYSISSVPTVILFKHGEEIDRFSGYRPSSNILEFINRNK